MFICKNCNRKFTNQSGLSRHIKKSCGKIKIREGYKYFIDKHGREKALHRYVMECKLGRKLKSNEIVHHIDEDKLNNEPDNLE